MDSRMSHPRPSSEADDPAPKHFKPDAVPHLKDHVTLPDAPAVPVTAAALVLLDSHNHKESSERGAAIVSESNTRDFDARVPGRYKTSLCSYFRKKGCKHGQGCQYAHSEEELKLRPDGSWDPTSERAKRMQIEKGVLERMTTAITAKAEEAIEQDECSEFGSEVVKKCINNLPWTWNTDNLKNFLEKHNFEYSHAKKKKGMNVGFVGFESVDQMLSSSKAIEGLWVQRKLLEIADVHPRPWEKQSRNHKCTVEETSTDGNGTVCAQDSLRVRDICDAVTPLSGTPYDEQLVLKKSMLAQVLKRLARNTRKSCAAGVLLPDWILASRDIEGLPCELQDIIPSPVITGYRNKCEFSIGCSADGKRVVGFQLGTFREGITAVAEPSRCQNVSRIAQAFASALLSFVEGSELPVWNKHSNTGFWRMLTVREGRGAKQTRNDSSDGQEVMLIVQVCPVGVPEGKVRQEYKNLAQHLSHVASLAEPMLPLTVLFAQEHIGISNAAPADCPLICLPISDPITGDVDKIINGHIHDQILGLYFQISPTAFFQVNTLAAEKLYELAGEWASLGPDTLLFDICCGTGTIGLTLAHHVGRVVGIEMNASAVVDARKNAMINDIQNCEFLCAKAEDVLETLLDKYTGPSSSDDFNVTESGALLDDEAGCPQRSTLQGRGASHFKNVVVIVDPPRCGLHPMVLKTLRLHERLQRIVYISCNPETLMANAVELCTPSEGNSSKENMKGSKARRNVKGMTSVSHARQRIKSMPESKPFKPTKAAGVDMFPHTNHCEMVMLFER